MSDNIQVAAAARKVCYSTIVSANYLAYARVLAASIFNHDPHADFRVLVVDRPEESIVSAAKECGLPVTYITELGIEDIERIAYKFDIVELNTALKPTFLKRLFGEGFTRVIYLDPDIQVRAPLSPVLQSMEMADITLTPHALTPVMDGLRPSDIDFLRNGSFNLGFIALRDGEDTRRMLNWWESRCLGLGFNDPAFGVFVDQKWVDLVPSYFESVRILRHPGCNVAYWNLHERNVEYTGDSYTVNGEPLIFFHFSGVVASKPDQLSKHQSRHRVSPGSALSKLTADYCYSLIAAGHPKLSMLPYTFGRLRDGTPITPIMRRALCCSNGTETRPFDPASAFQRRLREVGISRKKPGSSGNTSTLNFDETRPEVRFVNAVVRILASLLGASRVQLLLRYAALLSREAHFPAVLMRESLDLRHLPRR